jgi:hypothetical protein
MRRRVEPRAAAQELRFAEPHHLGGDRGGGGGRGLVLRRAHARALAPHQLGQAPWDGAHVLEAAIRSCAQRLHTLAWSCDSVAPTVTGFIDDLRSGYSTYDIPPDELRQASLAAGALIVIAAQNGWSIAEALAQVSVCDELFYLNNKVHT